MEVDLIVRQWYYIGVQGYGMQELRGRLSASQRTMSACITSGFPLRANLRRAEFMNPRATTGADIEKMLGQKPGYRVMKVDGGEMKSIYTFHGAVRTYAMGMVTEDPNGIYLYATPEEAQADIPPMIGVAQVLAKVVPLATPVKVTGRKFFTAPAVYVVSAVKGIPAIPVNVGDILFAPKAKKFFRIVRMNTNGSYTTSAFCTYAHEAVVEKTTKNLKKIANCVPVGILPNSPKLKGIVHDGTGWTVA